MQSLFWFCICTTRMAFQIKSDILLQFFLCLSMLMTSQSSVTDNIKNTLENKSNDFCQSFTVALIVGYVFSLSLYCYVVHQSEKKKNIHLNKAKELVKYICFITRRRKQMVVSQMHKLINFRQIRKESKEVLYYYFFLFK
jgi:hypothetical protein